MDSTSIGMTAGALAALVGYFLLRRMGLVDAGSSGKKSGESAQGKPRGESAGLRPEGESKES